VPVWLRPARVYDGNIGTDGLYGSHCGHFAFAKGAVKHSTVLVLSSASLASAGLNKMLMDRRIETSKAKFFEMNDALTFDNMICYLCELIVENSYI
jgi:hypothetical protein